jgi:hypothetical protein
MKIKKMKHIFFLIVYLFLSCNESAKSEIYYLKKVSFIDQKQQLIPSLIRIEFTDPKKVLLKSIEEGKLKNVFLYSISKEDRNYFHYLNETKIKLKHKTNKDQIILTLETSYFDSERNHKWKKSEIEKILETDIGLVIEKDTVRLKIVN